MRNSKIGNHFNNKLQEHPYILCICEGAAEEGIINFLVESNVLKFSQDDLVDGQVTRIRKAREIEKTFLNRDYGEHGLTICRILDSRNENFKLKKQYAEQYETFNIYTRPEIEILHILLYGEYDDFKKSGDKPSIYFKKMRRFRNHQFKSEDYIKELYPDINLLIHTIKEYDRICGKKRRAESK